MIRYDLIQQYSRAYDGMMFPQNLNTPFLFVYFSENSFFINDYGKLNLRTLDFRHIILPLTKIPPVLFTGEIKAAYKQLNLLSYSSNMNFPSNKNLIVDTSFFTQKVDKIYKPKSYRQHAGTLIKNLLTKTFQMFPANYRKILVYSIDTTIEANNFPDKKIFPILNQLKSEEIVFDDMLLVTLNESDPQYRLLISEKSYKFSRVISYLRKIKIKTIEEEEEKEVNTATNIMMKSITKNIKQSAVVKDAIQNYLSKNNKAMEKINDKKISDKEIEQITIASILYSVNGDFEKANRLSKTIPKKDLTSAMKKIYKLYSDDLLKKTPSSNTSTSIISQIQNLPSRVNEKTPEHIFEKRHIDFERNLKKDMANAFKILNDRDIPLKFDSIVIIDKPQKAGELLKTDIATVEIKLKDNLGKLQEIKINIPKIDPSMGTFHVNGQKKCLINQIVLNPISFPKEYDSKFESAYSMFHIYSKRTIRLKYLESYMGSFRLPFIIMLSFSFGFKETLNQYGLKYRIVEEKPISEKYFAKVPSSYIIFDDVNTELKEELVESFIVAKVNNYTINQEFLSKEYFNDLIIEMTGRIDSTYLITNNLDNIVDTTVRQVLINQQLPFELPMIMQYMATKCIAGFVQERNDISNQRIKNSEILVHLAQKQFLKAYTEYREQKLSGNQEAVITIPPDVVISQFSNLEIVQDMEYANPMEEMATLTKISPVGKSVGGIPDKQAIQLDARNVHPSYFGNIDPLDTAEGGNIGITQQLTVDAYITSARGLFGIKDFKDDEKSGILSTSASLVPFVGNNEGARIIMSTNQAKQMLPLKNPEPPITQSGYESLLTNTLSDSFIKRSPCLGKVTDITFDYIEIACNKGRKQKIDITPVQLKSGSGKNTLSAFRPIVKLNQSVKDREIIAEGNSISNGTISMGRNLSCCYMAYKGYNFEDGIVISDKLVKQDKLTSLHGIDVKTTLENNDKLMAIVERGKDTLKGEPLFRKLPGEIDELLGFDQDNEENVDVYDGQIIVKSPGGKVVDIEVYSNIDEDVFPQLKEHINRTNKKYKKPTKEKYTERGNSIKGIKIIFKIEQALQIGIGDKLCNRFGNKGIIATIEKEELMPRTPWGESCDIVLNPLGVINRMNLGQVYEIYCGLISKYASKQIVKTKSRVTTIKLFEIIMSGLDVTKGKKFSLNFMSKLKKLSSTQFKTMINQIEQTGFFPMIVPPFESPSYKQIIPLLKKLGLKSGYYMTLPDYGVKTYEPVPFGYTYMAKLEHIGEMKLHARSTGPTVGKTLQPTGGKARGGGQRFGEGDSYALACYNCVTIMSEMLGPLSDDIKTKNEILTEIIQTGDANFRPPQTSPTKELLNAYFVTMMLDSRE